MAWCTDTISVILHNIEGIWTTQITVVSTCNRQCYLLQRTNLAVVVVVVGIVLVVVETVSADISTLCRN